MEKDQAIKVPSYITLCLSKDASAWFEAERREIMNSSKPSVGIAPKAHSLKKREKNERRFRLITERMGDITSTLTFSPNPTYTYVNPSVEGILGYKPEELIGRSAWEYIHPDDKKNMLPLLKRCLGDCQSAKIPMSLTPKESMNHSYTLECRFRDKSGNWRYMESTVTFSENELLAISRDITARKKMEAELKRQAENLEELVGERTRELKEAERLAAIGELATMVGHDLRNPLQGISGAVYVLRTKLRTTRDEQVRTMLEIIEKDVQYSDKIINDLLDYSREMHLELTKINLSSIIKDALASVLVPETITLKLPHGEAKVNVDPEKMKRVFVNIIKNAVDAMPGGGTITIQGEESDDTVVIAFKDTGAGISKEVMEKLGKPLQTTKAKGMGMGLAICYRIVEAHHGSVTAKSIPGQGTTITVTLPLS